MPYSCVFTFITTLVSKYESMNKIKIDTMLSYEEWWFEDNKILFQDGKSAWSYVPQQWVSISTVMKQRSFLYVVQDQSTASFTSKSKIHKFLTLNCIK